MTDSAQTRFDPIKSTAQYRSSFLQTIHPTGQLQEGRILVFPGADRRSMNAASKGRDSLSNPAFIEMDLATRVHLWFMSVEAFE